MTKWLMDVKTSALEMKKSLEVDLMLRRYQSWMEGENTWDEKLIRIMVYVRDMLAASWRSFFKRSFDIACSIFGIVLSLPVMAAVAVAVRLDSKGPVIYAQTRVGLRGKLFTMYKFRTMRSDAETSSGPVWARKSDPRVTKVGDFLRKTHLDELPQLFNVLQGEMSLVGPRPERPYFVNEFRKVIPHYTKRLCAKPGITGLAQIKRSYDETIADVKRKLRYDCLYVRKMCPVLDIKVMALTVLAMVLKTGR